MKVNVAKNSGFCSSVSRAFKLVENLLESGKAPVQTYGDLVHNPDVVSFLEGKGVSVANSIDEILEGAHVVVRAHGVPDSEMARIMQKASFVYDGKCPVVGSLQNKVKEKVGEGYFAVVLGKLGHPEMVCVTGDLPEGSYSVVADASEAVEAVKSKNAKRVYLCAQTTKDPDDFMRVISGFGDFCVGSRIDFKAENTVCKPTGNAKRFTEALARESEIMVVIGGADSSNTQELVAVCEDVYVGCNRSVIHVLNETGLITYLEAGCFNGMEKVGVSAGTSTPPWVIDNVCRLLENYR